MLNKNRRIVIAGLGVISCLGIGWQEFWKNLIAGKSGINKIETFDTHEYDRHYGGEIKNFDFGKFLSKQKIFSLGRASQFALMASRLALEDAHLSMADLTLSRTCVCVGTTMGESQVIEAIVKKTAQANRMQATTQETIAYPANNISENVSRYLKLTNQSMLFANACAAGNFAIGYGYDLIRSNKADFVLAGGSDALSRIAFTGFSRLYAMAPETCQPFDKNRKGMLLGEGAGILLLESMDSALKRKAPIYAEILGYGVSCDAHHMTNPSIRGIARAIKNALKFSSVKVGQIDYINAHGTGTKENDKTECEAMKDVFGARLKRIPVSSIKSMLGHSMGAASALEASACCLTLKYGIIPPTINYITPDPDCDIDCVPNLMRRTKVKTILNNSSAFGGNNAVLVMVQKDPLNA